MDWSRTLTGTIPELAQQMREWLIELAGYEKDPSYTPNQLRGVYSQTKGVMEFVAVVSRLFQDKSVTASCSGHVDDSGDGTVSITYHLTDPPPKEPPTENAKPPVDEGEGAE